MKHRFRLALLASTSLAASWSSAALAQNEGFALDRFDPSERGSEWFTLESLQFDGDPKWTLGLVGDWAYKPLVLYQDGEEQAALVEHQAFAHVGASVILMDFLRFGLSVPLGYVSGEDAVVNGEPFAVASGVTLGDLRLGADARFFGKNRGPLRLGGGVQLHLPTGSRDAFSGDGSPRIVPRLMVAGDAGQFAWSGQLGVDVRTQSDDFAGEPFGSEAKFAAAVGARVFDDKLLVGPEIHGATGVTDSDAVFARKSTPYEVILGGHYQLNEEWRAGAGVGPGLSRGFGTPQLRVLASIEWSPAEPKPEPPKDADGDGIVDAEDACLETPGERTSDPETNGCPPPKDTDGDTILDDEDACPTVAGPTTNDPKTNGCPPPPDTDADGVVDEQDACPTVAGVATSDPKTNGCPPPPPDTDGDGIVDAEDACVREPGERNDDPKKSGCPKAVVVEGEIKILERIEFDTGKATIRPESDPVLEAVLKVLREHPEITEVRVEGHTDNRGGKGLNKALSRRRAAAVVKWLVDNGVEKQRLTWEGVGQDRPIESNDTDVGRQNNRRVEFHIVGHEGGTKTEAE
jgi:OmpA-OmpF porin, OOP family